MMFEGDDMSGNITWGRVARYNQLVGGLRLEQIRAEPVPCQIQQLHSFYGSQCFPSDATQNGDDFGMPLCTSADTAVGNTAAKTERRQSDHCFDLAPFAPAVNADDFLLDSSSGGDPYTGFQSSMVDGNHVYEFFLETYTGKDFAKQRLEYLRQRKWIDVQTDTVTMVNSAACE